MLNETPQQRAERKDMYLSRVSAMSGMAENYDEIMAEAEEAVESENPIISNE